ncbi:MAG: WG repeat-containing protein [Bacteroidaceae bacterium]|nr:WG repeat-containing protein [Bacteroidaceae bacterium]
MKKIFITLLSSALLLVSCLPYQEAVYLPVQQTEGGSWSIIDSKGYLAVKDAYPADAVISSISNGIYWVCSGKHYRLYSVGHPDIPVIDETFVNATSFFQTDWATVSSGSGTPLRIIDSRGNIHATLPQEISSCYGFSSDGYAVYRDEYLQEGLIDHNGKIIVPAPNASIASFSEGVTLVQKDYNDKIIHIVDSQGRQVGDINTSQYNPVSREFHEGKIIVCDANSDQPRFHLLNKQGECILTFDSNVTEMENTAYYQDGFLVFIGSNSLSGIIDSKGGIVLSPQYNALINYGKGCFAALLNDRWGVIDAYGEILIPFEYDYCHPTAIGDSFILQEGNTYFLFSPDGTKLTSFQGMQKTADPLLDFTSCQGDTSADGQDDDSSMETNMESYGLMSFLPEGTTKYTGDMGGYPIEFTITNRPGKGELSAIYKNVKYGTTMKMIGESLPADDGTISFMGEENGRQWCFELDGDADNITGTASGSNNWQFKVNLKRK